MEVMTYQPPRHILLRRHTDAIDDKDVAFLERALARQLGEVAAVYGLDPPGVSAVTPDTHLAQTEAVAIDLVDDDGQPGSVAHHGWNHAAKFAWSLVGVKEGWPWTIAASHEALEYFLNLRLDRWVPGPHWGEEWVYEICDPVEEDKYEIPVQLFGERRTVEVSNWVLPNYWGGATGPYDKMGRLTGPFTLSAGGYALVRHGGVIQEMGAAQSVRHGSTAKVRPVSRVALIRAQEAQGTAPK